MFKPESYPLDKYIEVDDSKVDFPNDICIAYAVCSKECGNVEFIVDGSSQVCQYCGKLLFRTAVKNYSLSNKTRSKT